MHHRQAKSAAEIQAFVIDWLAKELKIERQRISPDEQFVNLGLSSRDAVLLSGDLEDWLGRDLDPALLWDHPTIAGLAGSLVGA
jgi:acyl carrier protein